MAWDITGAFSITCLGKQQLPPDKHSLSPVCRYYRQKACLFEQLAVAYRRGMAWVERYWLLSSSLFASATFGPSQFLLLMPAFLPMVPATNGTDERWTCRHAYIAGPFSTVAGDMALPQTLAANRQKGRGNPRSVDLSRLAACALGDGVRRVMPFFSMKSTLLPGPNLLRTMTYMLV